MISKHPVSEHKDSIIAAIITFLCVLAILLILFFCRLSFSPAEIAQASTPELMEPEENFLEPEILQDLGEPDATANDAPAPVIQGEPEQAPVENNKLVIKGENTKPAPQREKLVSTTKESPVKTTTPPVSKEEASKITSSMADKFSGKNGNPEGHQGSNGSGGTGIGVKGNANGRTFLGCPLPDVALQHKTTVRVDVVIDADGNVISASASGGASAAIRRACQKAAKGARWSPKKGATQTRGSITFTITPK